jgi:hypothetical protein
VLCPRGRQETAVGDFPGGTETQSAGRRRTSEGPIHTVAIARLSLFVALTVVPVAEGFRAHEH